MPWVEEWPSQGACRGEDPDALFVQGAAQQQAKQVCLACPVRSECLAHALDTRTEFGVWGGTTERERRQLLREHPQVESWRRLLEGARNAHEGAPPVATPRRVPGQQSGMHPETHAAPVSTQHTARHDLPPTPVRAQQLEVS